MVVVIQVLNGGETAGDENFLSIMEQNRTVGKRKNKRIKRLHGSTNVS